MILEHTVVKQLLRGKRVEHTIQAARRPHVPGTELAVQLAATKAATTRVIVETVTRHPEHRGTWVLVLRPVQREPARLLTPAARPPYQVGEEDDATAVGYTDRLERAMFDEPEAVDEETLKRYAAENRVRFQQAHAELMAEREERSLARRLREATVRARREGRDITPELEAIRGHISRLEEAS